MGKDYLEFPLCFCYILNKHIFRRRKHPPHFMIIFHTFLSEYQESMLTQTFQTDMSRILENGISLSIRNDAAFIVGTDINIYEHQSSYNPNMPLRALVYFTTIVQELLQKRDWFSSHLIKIPTPHFAVFYNGMADRPEKEILKLSSSFEKPTENPELELICTVYNINQP